MNNTKIDHANFFRKSLSTCKIVLKNLKFHNFFYNKDNYLKFEHLCIFYKKKMLAKLQSNKTNLKTSIKFLVGGPFYLTHPVVFKPLKKKKKETLSAGKIN